MARHARFACSSARPLLHHDARHPHLDGLHHLCGWLGLLRRGAWPNASGREKQPQPARQDQLKFGGVVPRSPTPCSLSCLKVAYANDEAQLWVVRVFTGSIFFLFVVIMIVSVVFQSTLTHLLSTSKGTQVISFLPRKSREILLAAQAEKEEKTGFDETALN